MSSNDDHPEGVVPIGIKFKEPKDGDENGPILRLVQGGGGCNHRYHFRGRDGSLSGKMIHAHYVIREGAKEVECGICGTALDPVWVLMQLAGEESRWRQFRKAYDDEMRRLNERSRTKCDNCGKMTRISRK